uniref:Uncharacterized protein n=1 Tax=Rhinolophus ferrumequinum TaxID=59479 RepID=A0A671FFZ4_RHIFE
MVEPLHLLISHSDFIFCELPVHSLPIFLAVQYPIRKYNGRKCPIYNNNKEYIGKFLKSR